MTSPFYLELTDGTDSALFANAYSKYTPFPIAQPWAPSVARLRRNALGNRPPVDPTEEEIPLHVLGGTSAETMANAAKLVRLLDNAERWKHGERLSPVILKYVPPKSETHDTATPLQSVVHGRSDGGFALSGLDPELRAGHDYFWIQNVNARLMRMGQWLGESESASSSAAACGTRHHIAFTDSHDEFSPLKVVIDNLTPGAALAHVDGFVFVARNKPGTTDVTGSYLQSYAAETMTAASWTTVASALNPLGTTVLRYTAGGTSFVGSGTLTLTAPLTKCKRIYVYATLRNNSVSGDHQVYGEFTSAGGTKTLTTAPVFIDHSSVNPRAVCLGSISIPVDEIALPNASYPTFRLYVASTAAGPTLDFDNLVFLGAEDEGANVITIKAVTLPNQSNIDLVFDPQALTSPLPTATLEYSSVQDALSYDGNLWSNTVLDRVTLLWMQPSVTYWRYTNNAGTLQTFTFTVTRRKSYLAPQ